MTHENEYHANIVQMLELIWGKGYMAPGGRGNVAKMLRGLETKDKRILDIGCGIGGPAMEMASVHGAELVGIDLEAPLIERARRRASTRELADRCQFQTVTAGSLPFEDNSFDIVTSAGGITQTADKTSLLSEVSRILKPSGHLTCYEWMTNGDAYSGDMHYWFELEGLTYELETLERFAEFFSIAGFQDVVAEDASAWYRVEARREYQLLKGDLRPNLLKLLGHEEADNFIENWRAMVVVIDAGEMRQGYCRGRKPSSI